MLSDRLKARVASPRGPVVAPTRHSTVSSKRARSGASVAEADPILTLGTEALRPPSPPPPEP
jgi:hypothetical protein